MSKPKVLRVIEVSHPDKYNEKMLRYEDLYLKATKLSDTKECLVYLRMENRPYVIAVIAGTLDDDDGAKAIRMRLFCVFRTLKG
jgi:hypothetical protein